MPAPPSALLRCRPWLLAALAALAAALTGPLDAAAADGLPQARATPGGVLLLPLELLGRGNARALATEMLQRVGLGERLTRYPRTLSGGEQQRVALARAFVVEPAVLLADEPTGSLDHATGEKVMALMFEMNRESGTTLVLVTHDRALAARCERQLHIEAGRLLVD